jgi:hypothetical protein
MEELFVSVARVASLLVEVAAVLVVTFGSAEAFIRLVWIVATPGATHGERKAIGADSARGFSSGSSSSLRRTSLAASSHPRGTTLGSSARSPRFERF